MKKERTLYYDIIRIIACILVIVNHTIYVFYQYSSFPLKTWIISDYLFFFAKIAVPLFIMLSGALLLSKEDSYEKLLKYRVLKILLILIIWTILYKIFDVKHLLSLKEIFCTLKSAINEPIYGHLWYLYMLIAMYLITPFIRKMIKNFTQKDFLFLFLLWIFFCGILPFIQILYNIKYSIFFMPSQLISFAGFYIFGFYLSKHNFNKRFIKYLFLLLLISLTINSAYTFFISKNLGHTSSVLDTVLTFPIMLSALSFFYIIKHYGNILSKLINKKYTITNIIYSISDCILGIYLIHIMILRFIEKTTLYNIIKISFLNPIISLLIYDIFIFFICYIIIYIFRRIPLIKLLVN